jgi:3-oxoacyl-[acyl-carrier protein] reductase
MGKLNNKIAVVTGGSKGIGAAIAKAFAQEGATVVLTYSRGKEGAEDLVQQILESGGDAVAVGANFLIENEINQLFEQVKTRFGRVDVLVNNAGVIRFAAVENYTVEEFNRVYHINVLANLLATKAACRLFPETGGSIVNISSAAASMALPTLAIYSSSKAAVDVITKSLARELAPRRIRVNAINPGYVITDGIKAGPIAGSPFEEKLIDASLLRRAGVPEEIAAPAVFLASEDARFITGETLYVSGGAAI